MFSKEEESEGLTQENKSCLMTDKELELAWAMQDKILLFLDLSNARTAVKLCALVQALAGYSRESKKNIQEVKALLELANQFLEREGGYGDFT